VDRAATGGAQVADADGDGRKGVQVVAELVQGQGLDVELQVGGLEVRRGIGKGPELEGAMDMGPRRRAAYSRAISGRRHQEA